MTSSKQSLTSIASKSPGASYRIAPNRIESSFIRALHGLYKPDPLVYWTVCDRHTVTTFAGYEVSGREFLESQKVSTGKLLRELLETPTKFKRCSNKLLASFSSLA